jgi:hypothetical protein
VRFTDAGAAARAAELLRPASEIEVVAADADLLTVETTGRIGELLEQLGDAAREITAIDEERVPLRQVLADVLTKSSSQEATS